MSHFNVDLHLNVKAVQFGSDNNSDVRLKKKCIKCSLQLSVPVIHFPDVWQGDVTFTGSPNLI